MRIEWFEPSAIGLLATRHDDTDSRIGELWQDRRHKLYGRRVRPILHHQKNGFGLSITDKPFGHQIVEPDLQLLRRHGGRGGAVRRGDGKNIAQQGNRL
jgi:hypothetical protein